GCELVEIGAADLTHGDPCAVGRAENRLESLRLPGATREKHLDDAPGGDRLGHGPSPGHEPALRPYGRTLGAHVTTAIAKHPIPSPASPNPSGRVALTEILSIP